MKRLLAGCVLVAILAGCGGGGSSPPNYRGQWAADTNPIIAPLKEWGCGASNVPTVAFSLDHLSDQLAQQSWPPGAQADINALALALRTMGDDLDAGLINQASGPDGQLCATDFELVNSDLGIPNNFNPPPVSC